MSVGWPLSAAQQKRGADGLKIAIVRKGHADSTLI
jgi:hypothetical protein